MYEHICTYTYVYSSLSNNNFTMKHLQNFIDEVQSIRLCNVCKENKRKSNKKTGNWITSIYNTKILYEIDNNW